MSELMRVLMDQDGMNYREAEEAVKEAKQRVNNGEDPEEILLEEFGLEPDYVFDLIG